MVLGNCSNISLISVATPLSSLDLVFVKDTTRAPTVEIKHDFTCRSGKLLENVNFYETIKFPFPRAEKLPPTYYPIDECTLIICRHRNILVPLSSPGLAAKKYRPTSSSLSVSSLSRIGSVFGIRKSQVRQQHSCGADDDEAQEKVQIE